MKYFLFSVLFLSFSLLKSNDFSDLKIGEEVSIKENSVIFFLDKTNCAVYIEATKQLMNIVDKLEFKAYLIISGEPEKVVKDFIANNKFNMEALDDKDFKYSKEFKIKDTPALFGANILGKIQFMSPIRNDEISPEKLTPNRKRIPILSLSNDYFYTQRTKNNLYTYNPSQNSIIKIADYNQINAEYQIKNNPNVIKCMKLKNDTLLALEYSTFENNKIILLDSNLKLIRTIPIYSKDKDYKKNYSIGQDFLFLNNKILCSCYNFYDSIITNIKTLEIDCSTGELKQHFTWDDSTNNNAIFIKNYEQIMFFDDIDAKNIFVNPNFKIDITDKLNLKNIKNHYGISNAFLHDNKIYLFVAYFDDGYGSQISRLNYKLLICDEKFNLLSEHNLYQTYNNYSFVFFDFVDKNTIEMLGRDEYGVFIEKIDL